MSVLKANKLTKYYGADEIFSNVTVDIPPDARVAVVGPNGAGKTTMIKIFIGEELPTEGDIYTAKGARIAYLPQRPELVGNHTLWQEAMKAFDALKQMEIELGELAMQMGASDAAVEAYGKLQSEFEHLGGYDYDTKARMVLSGVGFEPEDYETPLQKLSGGQKTRAMLVRLLLEEPDLLILDEPTNHLDIYAVEWLESFLKGFNGAVLAISHDRRFIDNFANQVWEMEWQRVEVYRGNYSQYMQQRDERRERLQKEFEKQQEFISKEMDYIRKHMGSRWTAQAKGRLKKLQTMQKRGKIIDSSPQDRGTMNLKLTADARSGDEVVKTDGLTIGYNEPLFTIDELLLYRGETAAIIGPNGAGKSTLLKTLIGELAPLDGTSKLGAQVEIGYFAQAHEGLDPRKSVIDVIMESGNMGIAEARSFLGAYLFSGEDVFRDIASLSGGERGRVALAQLALSGANLLLLDEPTNHLDIDSQEILQAVIEGFNGTVLLVSHDRALIDALSTQVWAIRPSEGVDIYEGTYSEYMSWRRQREALQMAQQQQSSTNTSAKAANYATKVRGLTPYQLKARVSEIETEIANLETELETVTTAIETESSNGRADKVIALSVRYSEIETALEAAMEEWSELAEHVE
ncbi:MAG: ABC-F family ATP-binding cassette domain-containing protein [Phototrophicaceae bacterium]